jgi:hypothetical protein
MRQCAYSLLERSKTTPVIVAAVPTDTLAGVLANPGRFQPAPELGTLRAF